MKALREDIKVYDIGSVSRALRELAAENCEGCRLAWRLNGDHHREPVPTRCDVLHIRQAIRVLNQETE